MCFWWVHEQMHISMDVHIFVNQRATSSVILLIPFALIFFWNRVSYWSTGLLAAEGTQFPKHYDYRFMLLYLNVSRGQYKSNSQAMIGQQAFYSVISASPPKHTLFISLCLCIWNFNKLKEEIWINLRFKKQIFI